MSFGRGWGGFWSGRFRGSLLLFVLGCLRVFLVMLASDYPVIL